MARKNYSHNRAETLPEMVSLLNLWNVSPMNNEGVGVSPEHSDDSQAPDGPEHTKNQNYATDHAKAIFLRKLS
jgi:hypothetical protein